MLYESPIKQIKRSGSLKKSSLVIFILQEVSILGKYTKDDIIRMIDENNVVVVAYPIFSNSRRDALTVNQTLRVLNSVFNPCN